MWQVDIFLKNMAKHNQGSGEEITWQEEEKIMKDKRTK